MVEDETCCHLLRSSLNIGRMLRSATGLIRLGAGWVHIPKLDSVVAVLSFISVSHMRECCLISSICATQQRLFQALLAKCLTFTVLIAPEVFSIRVPR
eukprot:scaffold172647_cov22-Prasinocladus_malaysianus.AAC.1